MVVIPDNESTAQAGLLAGMQIHSIGATEDTKCRYIDEIAMRWKHRKLHKA